MNNNKLGRLPYSNSMTAILITESAEMREAMHTECAIKILAGHGHTVSWRQVYSLLNGGHKWFTRIDSHRFKLTREGYLRAMKQQGLEPLPQAVQKYCTKCGDPFIDETLDGTQELCAKDKCKRAKWTAREKAYHLSEAAKARLDRRNDGIVHLSAGDRG